MLEDILRDYPNFPQYIKQREEELFNPVTDDDENVGGGRALNKRSDPVLRTTITINDDKYLWTMKKERKAIDECLDEAGNDTELIIKELYFVKYQNLTLGDLCARQIIPLSRSTAYRLRNNFLEELAKKLNLDTM